MFELALFKDKVFSLEQDINTVADALKETAISYGSSHISVDEKEHKYSFLIPKQSGTVSFHAHLITLTNGRTAVFSCCAPVKDNSFIPDQMDRYMHEILDTFFYALDDNATGEELAAIAMRNNTDAQI